MRNVLIEGVRHEESGAADTAAFAFPDADEHDLLAPDYWRRLADHLASFTRVDELADGGIELPDPFA